MALDSIGRKPVLEALLTQASIPHDGVNVININAVPPDVTINFRPEATQEQIDLGNQIKDSFDWRRRRPLGLGACLAVINNLTAGQIAIILRLQAADYLRRNPVILMTVADLADVPLPLDEVDPN